MARRDAGQQAANLAPSDSFQVLTDDADVPVVAERRGVHVGPHLPDELVQVRFGALGILMVQPGGEQRFLGWRKAVRQRTGFGGHVGSVEVGDKALC